MFFRGRFDVLSTIGVVRSIKHPEVVIVVLVLIENLPREESLQLAHRACRHSARLDLSVRVALLQY